MLPIRDVSIKPAPTTPSAQAADAFADKGWVSALDLEG